MDLNQCFKRLPLKLTTYMAQLAILNVTWIKPCANKAFSISVESDNETTFLILSKMSVVNLNLGKTSALGNHLTLFYDIVGSLID